jgi:Galactose oxidase, central domain/Kelch motif
MAMAHANHSAMLLLDGHVLVVDGGGVESAELYDPATGRWFATGGIEGGRSHHTATLLLDGSVLVAGGSGPLGLPVASAELYDPATGQWSATGSMAEGRARHTATLLGDGRVLVVGGSYDPDGDSGLASAELYDPESGTWTATRSMTTGRSGQTATLLPDGSVLVAGGIGAFVNPMDPRSLASAETYDPITGRWTVAGTLSTPRVGHTATLLDDGTVLVVGGNRIFSDPLASVEIFSPETGSWTTVASMTRPHDAHSATLLPDGRVLTVGGRSGDMPIAGAELYDPVGRSWIAAVEPPTARQVHSATLLPDGRVLVAGGTNATGILDSAELYDHGGS